MFPNDPQGGKGLPWSQPEAPMAKPPKSAPGEGLKQFVESGALKAFQDPHGASEAKQNDPGQHLMSFLRMMQPI